MYLIKLFPLYSSMTFGALGWLPGGNIYSPHSLHGEALPERGTVRKLLRCRYDHFLAQKVWVLLWALLFLTSCKQWYFFIFNCFVFLWLLASVRRHRSHRRLFRAQIGFVVSISRSFPGFDSRKEGTSNKFLLRGIGLDQDLPQVDLMSF